jgi:5-methylcytosine-specific restriction protein B
LPKILAASLAEDPFRFGSHDEFIGGAGGNILVKPGLGWQEWLRNPEESGIHVAMVFDNSTLLQKSSEELSAQVARNFQQLFPLIIVATSDDPLGDISEYMDLFGNEKEVNPPYSLSDGAKETCFDEAMLAQWVRAIERKGQAVLYGPPGTGKTYIAERLARHLIGGDDGFSEVVQFHPAYAYEDFVQGIRPQARDDGTLFYPVVPGRFLEFCSEARKRKGRCVLIIDEINRANLARVFGELMYLLEYRDREVPLASGGEFCIPSNVRIIGTMNTADRSIALVDHALRRRFAFLALYPQYDVLRKFHSGSGFPVEKLIGTLEALNKKIGDRHYEVGITFFLRKDVGQHLEDIWRMEVEPYLEEYFFDQRDTVKEFSWDKVKDKMLP